MSVIINPSETITVSTIHRTWRTEIESPVGGSVGITAHREEILATADRTIIKQGVIAPVKRALAAVLPEQVTLADGTVLTAAQTAEAVGLFIEKWAADDTAADAYQLDAISANLGLTRT